MDWRDDGDGGLLYMTSSVCSCVIVCDLIVCDLTRVSLSQRGKLLSLRDPRSPGPS
jgi:hypothetical protein